MPHAYGTAAGPVDIDREDMLPTYTRILLEELLPQVEKQYNVSTQPTGRAIAGLSMGGAESMHTGLNHLETFAWLGSFSGAYNNWPLTRPAQNAAGGGGPRFTLVESRLPDQFPKLDAKPPERCLHHVADAFRPAVQHARLLLPVFVAESELGGDHDPVTDGGEGFANQLLIGEGTVNLSRVEKGYALIDSRADKTDPLLLFDGRAIAVAQSHATESERRNFEITLSQFALLHRLPFTYA